MQRFGSGNEDMRRPADEALPLGGRRVAGADGRFQGRKVEAHPPGRFGNAFERMLQIAGDVVIERLERRDVEDAHAAGRRGFLSPEMIEAGEEGGQRLAGAGRRQDQRVPAGRDERPSLPLRGRRFAERGAEPLPNRRQEEFEGIVGVHLCICTGSPGGGGRCVVLLIVLQSAIQ